MIEMNSIFFFPTSPGKNSGYSIAVSSDLEYFKPSDDDFIVYIVEKRVQEKTPNTLYIYRNNFIFRLSNLLTTFHPSFFSGLYLYIRVLIAFKKRRFNTVVIGDINFSNIVYYISSNYVIFRLHNLYLKMFESLKINNILFYNLRLFHECYIGKKIESNVIEYCLNKKDSSEILFITEEERNYINEKYNTTYRTLNIGYSTFKKNVIKGEYLWDNKVVWFGGVSSHKKIGLDYFIDKVYLNAKKDNPQLNFELFGNGTIDYHQPDLDILAHGFVEVFDFSKYSNSLFINPDIVGGGIKLKLFTLYNENVHCLSTPLGIEGFPNVNTWDNLIILNIENWITKLKDYEYAKI